ncbi:PD-(D/E)XK nuclease superfamily protein [bacterium A37T11]|nr:PD-(D/E)XK nuclease superfamily protein [bacterium A37T11]
MHHETNFQAGNGDLKNLPVGLDSFEDFPLLNSIYVDKTEYIFQMLKAGGKSFFLSRPRRFGKSLLLSTIKAVFEGKKNLFKGLYIEDKIDWETYPVIKLDMTLDAGSVEKFEEDLKALLLGLAANFGFEIPYHTPPAILREVIRLLVVSTGKKVVVLVDEYDKPILDAIDDPKRAEDIRTVLQTFYGVLKASSSMLKFLIVSGITKVSQTSIFSGFNNLNDISLDASYAGICGYSQAELEYFFSGHIENLARNKTKSKAAVLADIKHWYNGYSWDGNAFVYNPYSVLLLFEKGLFNPFWYNTGTPTFLLKLLNTGNNLNTVLKDAISVPNTFIEGQTIDKLNSIGLLFQSGYLTIKSFDEEESSYELQIPNEEVRKAISELILMDIYRDNVSNLHELSKNIRVAFSEGNTTAAVESLDILLANTTHNTHDSNKNESHYQALFQLAMILSNINHIGESTHGNGRTDAVLLFDKHIYVVEIKFTSEKEGLEAALASGMKQINEKLYYKPYLNQGKTVHKLALAFTKGKVVYKEEEVIQS